MAKKLTYVEKLQRKLDKELESTRKELLQLPPEELLKRAWEYGIRQQLSETPWTCVISEEQAEVLLGLPNTLDALYAGFTDDPSPYLDGFGEIVDRQVESVLAESQQQEASDDMGPAMQL